MQGKTHLVIGLAAALAVNRPETLPELVLGSGIAAVGAIISDIDVEPAYAAKKAEQILTIISGICISIMALEFLFHIGIIELLSIRSNTAMFILAIVIMVVICYYGKGQPHRSFMHSILALITLSGCISFIMPSVTFYFVIAFLSHLILDLMNYKGEQLLFPVEKRYSFELCKSDGKVNDCILVAGYILVIGNVLVFFFY